MLFLNLFQCTSAEFLMWQNKMTARPILLLGKWDSDPFFLLLIARSPIGISNKFLLAPPCMIRSASRHSKSANDAYIRGDHAAACHFSLKAQQEWAAAERLNARAAKEILDERNRENDIWTLDLHGLHAAEAVQALHERLMNVESLVSLNGLAARQGMLKESGMSVAASMQSPGQLEMGKFGRQHLTSRQRIRLLQVIPGMCAVWW